MFLFPNAYKRKESYNYTKEYNLFYILTTFLGTISIILGGGVSYFYLISIDALDVFFSEPPILFMSISFWFFILFSMLLFIIAYPYLIESHLYRNNIPSHRVKVRNIETKKAYKFNLLSFLFILFSLSIITSHHQDRELYQNNYVLVGNTYFFFFLLLPIIINKHYEYYKKLRPFFKEKSKLKNNSKKGRIKILCEIVSFSIALFSISDLLLIYGIFYTGFSGLFHFNDLTGFIKFLVYPVIIILVFLITPTNHTEQNVIEKTKKILGTTLIVIILTPLPSMIMETNFMYNLMKLTGKADNKIKPYYIKNLSKYDIYPTLIYHNITCGRLLWNSGEKYVFLPSYSIPLTENFKIPKEDIELYQGKNHNLLCMDKMKISSKDSE